jgi:hypothetical protein
MMILKFFNTFLLFDGDEIEPFVKKLRISAILLKLRIEVALCFFSHNEEWNICWREMKRNVVTFDVKIFYFEKRYAVNRKMNLNNQSKDEFNTNAPLKQTRKMTHFL